VRAARDPAARLSARRADVEEQLSEDQEEPHRREVTILADAIARHLFAREEAGLSPRSLNALRSDLQAAAMLVFMYESADGRKILEHFRYGAPLVVEFRRKFTDSPSLVARYERNLQAFAKFLTSTTVAISDT